MAPKAARVTALFIGVLGFTVFAHLCVVCYHYPLFPFSPEDIDWSNAWLMMTVLDYYGSTLCMCAIAFYSEANFWVALLWSTLFCLLGSPFVCTWCVWRLLSHNSLKLSSSDTRYRQYDE